MISMKSFDVATAAILNDKWQLLNPLWNDPSQIRLFFLDNGSVVSEGDYCTTYIYYGT